MGSLPALGRDQGLVGYREPGHLGSFPALKQIPPTPPGAMAPSGGEREVLWHFILILFFSMYLRDYLLPPGFIYCVGGWFLVFMVWLSRPPGVNKEG